MFLKMLNTFGTKFITALCNLALAVVISRYIGAAGKGEQSMIVITLGLIQIVAGLVGGPTLVYLLPRLGFSKTIWPSYIWAFIVSCLFGVLLLFVPMVSRYYLIHVILLSFPGIVTSIHFQLLIGREKVIEANVAGLLQPVMSLLTLGVFGLLGAKLSLSHYLISLYIAYFMSIILSVYMLRNDFKNLFKFDGLWDLSLWKQLLGLGFVNQLAVIMQLLNSRFTFYLLNFITGSAMVGVYSNGISIAESIWLISGSIAMVQYARISNSEDILESASWTLKLFRLNIVLMLASITVLCLIPASFFPFVFGSEFTNVKEVILWISPGIFMLGITTIFVHFFSGIGMYHVNTFASGVSLVGSLFFGFMLIPELGLKGAAITNSISYTLYFIVEVWFFRKTCKTRFKDYIPDISEVKITLAEVKNMLISGKSNAK